MPLRTDYDENVHTRIWEHYNEIGELGNAFIPGEWIEDPSGILTPGPQVTITQFMIGRTEWAVNISFVWSIPTPIDPGSHGDIGNRLVGTLGQEWQTSAPRPQLLHSAGTGRLSTYGVYSSGEINLAAIGGTSAIGAGTLNSCAGIFWL